MRKISLLIKIILLALIGLYMLMFFTKNDQLVSVDPVLWPAQETVLSWCMLIAFVLGFCFSFILASILLLKGSHEKRKVKKELKLANKELEKHKVSDEK